MRPQLPPRTFREDRPDRYVKLELDDGRVVWFKLPNEKRQMQLLKFVGKYAQGIRSEIQIVAELDMLAAIVGACWFHRDHTLEAATPWREADQAAVQALKDNPFDLEAVVYATVPDLTDKEGKPIEESDEERVERQGWADNDALEDAEEAHKDGVALDARAAVLIAFGEAVLDELDDIDLGSKEDVPMMFGAVTNAISANFTPQNDVDAAAGNGQPPQDGAGSSD